MDEGSGSQGAARPVLSRRMLRVAAATFLAPLVYAPAAWWAWRDDDMSPLTPAWEKTLTALPAIYCMGLLFAVVPTILVIIFGRWLTAPQLIAVTSVGVGAIFALMPGGSPRRPS